MKTLLADSTVVVIANDVNLSIFKPTWLAKSGFLRADELEGDVVVSPILVRIPTKSFELTVMPNRIQMSFRGPAPGRTADVDRVLGGIVQTLPHTPYSACGLNFNYLATVADDNFQAWDVRLFASEAARRAGATNAAGARFGSYCSFDVLGGRMKLDMKPTRTIRGVREIAEDWQESAEVMRMSFNYHFEVGTSDAPAECVRNALGKWDEAAAHSQATVARLAED